MNPVLESSQANSLKQMLSGLLALVCPALRFAIFPASAVLIRNQCIALPALRLALGMQSGLQALSLYIYIGVGLCSRREMKWTSPGARVGCARLAWPLQV